MFEFIKKAFIAAINFFSSKVLIENSLECISRSNQECKARSQLVELNNNESMFYPCSIYVNK